MEMAYKALNNIIATNHVWVLGIWNEASYLILIILHLYCNNLLYWLA